MLKRIYLSISISFLFVAALFLSGCVHIKYPEQTISGRAVILAGEQYTDLRLPVPPCNAPEEFLIQGVQAAPELLHGNTSITVANLPLWGISVPVSQRYQTATIKVDLTAVARGPKHISAELPAGQYIMGAKVKVLPIRLSLLGGAVAKDRFEFNVHVTGICGIGYVATPVK